MGQRKISLTGTLELGRATGAIVGGLRRTGTSSENRRLGYGSPERSRWEHEMRLVKSALRCYGLHESRLGLRSVRVTPLARVRNYKSVFQLASLRHGVFALYLYRLPRGGAEREATLLRSAEGLRSPEGRVTEAALRSQMAWVEALQHDADVTVPGPVRTLDGSLTCDVSTCDEVEGRRCALVRWMPGEAKVGEEVAKLDWEDLCAFGRYIARLHRHAEAFSVPGLAPHGFVRPRWDSDYVFGNLVFGQSAPLWLRGEAVYSASEMEIFRAVSERVEENLKAVGERHDVFGFIHGDLLPRNLLLHRGALFEKMPHPWAKRSVSAVDFDECGFGYYMFDLAWTLRALGDHSGLGGDTGAPQRAALLEGYLQERPLPEHHLREHLPACSVVRAVMMVNRVLRWESPEARSWGPPLLSSAIREMEAYLAVTQ